VARRLEPDNRQRHRERGPLQLEENGSRPVWDATSERHMGEGGIHDALKGDLLATLF
jgi:hypothetical protein